MYNAYNLKDWPFRTVPDEAFAQVWAGRVDTREKVGRLLKKMQLVPKSGLHILWANFGMGKTHTLLHLKYRCEQTRGNLIPVYVQMPKRSKGFMELYQAIVQELPYGYLGDQLMLLNKESPDGVTLHPLFRKAPGVVRAIQAIRGQDIEPTVIARDWLAGKPGLSRGDLNMIRVKDRIRSPEEALNALEALCKLAVYGSNNQKKLVVMIDEYQRIGELRTQFLNEINSSMHTFFNANAIGLELVLSFSFGRRENVDFLLSPELRSRAEPQMINLDVMSITEAAEFAQDLLGQFHIEPNGNTTFPFTGEAVRELMEYIAAQKVLTPRRVMLIAGHVLQEYIMDHDGPPPEGIAFREIQGYLSSPELGRLDRDEALEDEEAGD